MLLSLSTKIMRDFGITVLAILPLVSCSTSDETSAPGNSRLHTINDLSMVACVFHIQAMGQPIDDIDNAVRHAGDGSVTVRRAQQDCYEKVLKD